jgi:putative DNA primase/helicase
VIRSIDWNGPARQPCVNCARHDRDKTMGVTVDERGGVAHCHRCGHTETMRGIVAAAAKPQQARQRHETLSDYGRELWEASRPLSGPARAYLEARACVIPPDDGDLRWHPALKHPPTGTEGPALVALITDAVTREPLTLHRTWVQADGRKAPLDPPRMLLGGHRKAGGLVRLWPDEAVTMGLAIAEGIETCLSLAHAYRPTWATVDAGNLAALPVLDGIECLLIGADHDDAGQRAAENCASRWAAAGVAVSIALPAAAGHDLNDLALAT